MTTEEAIALGKSRWWVGKPAREVATFQLRERKLCMDFPDFHKAVTEALGRQVWTHEFSDPERLLREMYGEFDPPSQEQIFQQLIDRVGADRVMVVKST